MPLPPITVIAACGSIITAFKSGWELSRMLKKKDLEVRMDKEATAISQDLQRAYREGLMSETAYEKWYDRFIVALAEKDGMEIRRVRKHLELLKGAPRLMTEERSRSERRKESTASRSKSESRAKSASRDKSASRRRHESDDSGYDSSDYEDYDQYEEKPQHRRSLTYGNNYYNPNASLEADDARRRYSTNSYALPSPYRGEIDYTRDPAMQRSNSTSGRIAQGYRSGSSSGSDGRGRARSRSLRQEPRIKEEEFDEDEYDAREAYDPRRQQHAARPDYRSGHARHY